MTGAITQTPANSARGRSMLKSKVEVKPEDYNAVVKAAQLSNIALTKSEFEMDKAYREVPVEKHKNKYSHTWKFIEFSEEDGWAGGSIEWSITVLSGRKKGLKLKAVYMIVYGGLLGLKPEAVELFVQRVGKVATYPYFRSHVSQLSWASGAELPLLPVISA